MVASLSAGEIATFRQLIAGPVRRHRILRDAPEFSFALKPWLMPPLPGENPDHFLVPRPAEETPIAHILEVLQAQLLDD